MKFEIIRETDWISRHQTEIEGFRKIADFDNHYFASPWLQVWFKRQISGTVPVLLIVRDPHGSLVGFWPFVERPGMLGSKGLWPYVYDEANYFHPICLQSAISELVKGLQSLLGEFLFCWIPLVIDSFWYHFSNTMFKNGKYLSISRSPRKTALLIPQEETEFEDFWDQQVGSKSRKSFRYDQKALSKKGEISIQNYSTFKEIRSVMPATCVVEVESWKSKEGAGLYTIRGKRGFFFELLPELAKQENARVAILSLDDQPIAWQVELLGSGNLGIHHLAFDQRWKKYSPGKQLLHHQISLAWKEGRTVDFLPGNFEYKEKISTRVESVHEFHWFKRSIRGFLAKRLILGNIKVRQKIRQKSGNSKVSKTMKEILKEKNG